MARIAHECTEWGHILTIQVAIFRLFMIKWLIFEPDLKIDLQFFRPAAWFGSRPNRRRAMHRNVHRLYRKFLTLISAAGFVPAPVRWMR